MKPFYTPVWVRSGLLAVACCLLALPPATAQYCNTSLGGSCTLGNEITSVEFNTLSNTSTCTNVAGTGAYTAYPASTTTTSVMQGNSYPLTVKTLNGNSIASVWIDYDHSFTFDPSEWQQVYTNDTAGTITVNIPLGATTGTTVMRVRSRTYTAQNGSGDACTTFGTGEAEDYTITITAAPLCSGVPATPTVTPAGPVASCAGGSVTFFAQVAAASGYGFQWQVSTNGGTTWTDIAGANSQTFTATITGPAQYRVALTCTATGGGTSTSAAVSVTAAGPAYATLPYSNSFEPVWQNFCAVQDIPGPSWTNQPATGDASWRRDDDETSAPWTNPFGLYYPSASSGDHSARWNVSGTTQGDTGNLNLYLNCSASTGSKQLYFDFIHQWSTDDSLLLFLSTDGGASYTFVRGFDTAQDWKRQSVPIASNSAQTVLRFQAKKTAMFSYSDIGIDSVYVAPPCSGAPAAGTVVVQGPICAGSTVTFTTTGTTLAGNLAYQWQQAATSSGPWTAIAGANSPSYTTTLLTSACYRLVVTCVGSNQSATTGSFCATFTGPTYAMLPYTQGFESWSSRCTSNDIPNASWTNQPADGDASWRRDDEGGTANWNYTPGGEYLPPYVIGAHSARFHSYEVPSGVTGDLNLYVDASPAGTKELQFYYRNDGYGFSFGAIDSLRVSYSTNNGASFTPLTTLDSTVGWTYHVLPLTAYTAQTIIRFRGVGDYGNSDIGLDQVRVLLPCSGRPTAGTITPASPCANTTFQLKLTGMSAAGGLNYIWQSSPSATGPWTALPGSNSPLVNTSIAASTYFRAIVICSNGGQRDTSAPVLFSTPPFYQCYCTAYPYYSDYNIGNVTIKDSITGATLLDNGVASPLTDYLGTTYTYSDFTTLPADTLYHNRTYKFKVTGITSYSYFFDSYADVYIDLNQDGVFDPVTELVLDKILLDPDQTDSAYFNIPATAKVGLTGMRVVLMEGTWNTPSPCVPSYTDGETEDYRVFINYPPCTGTPTAGIVEVSDTSVCSQDVITLIDTTHQKQAANLEWHWEASADSGTTWTTIPGSSGKDTIYVSVTGTMQYRLVAVCDRSGQSSASNVVTLRLKPIYKCYCYAYATGGAAADNSDIGAFTLGNFVTNTGGPHLNNPNAVRRYTDWTDLAQANLEVDSTYDVSAYHIMKTGTHADAKVSLFIDYDNNWQYDLPNELVWTAYTSASTPYVDGTITIPVDAVQGVYTGMRLVLNEDVGLNGASDTACGLYVSGETEDYLIRFRARGAAGIKGSGGLLQDAALFPNPTTGRSTLQLRAAQPLKTVTLQVTDLTGRVVLQQQFSGVPAQFQTEVDLGSQPRGVYLVELRTDGDRLVRKLVVR